MTEESRRNLAFIVPTFNGIDTIKKLVHTLKGQTYKFDLYFIDSGSTDGTYEYLLNSGQIVDSIDSKEFNHAKTRQMMIYLHPGYEFYGFLTQDVYLEEMVSIEKLMMGFSNACVGASYGRQLPHLDATKFSAYARLFNYPNESRITSLQDSKRLGFKTIFLSNSFSILRAEALSDVGGLPSSVIFGEDMWIAAKLVKKGWKINYVSDSLCRHSHNYTIKQEFCRYFDIGVFHKREGAFLADFNNGSREGLKFILSEIKFLGFKSSYLIPISLIRNFSKLFGYKLGKYENYLPLRMKIFISMNKNYWK